MIGDYVTTKTLGTGAFGTVKLAKKKNSETLYAIKSISKQSILRSQMGAQVKKEITILKDLDHPNIVQIFEVLMSTEYLYIVMDFVSGGELYSKITRTGKLPDKECRRYVRQLCSALNYCHARNVCHRDIKPENILLDKNDNALLADFGFASIMQVDVPDEFESSNRLESGSMEGSSKVMKEMSTMCGTMAYMAPEILNRDKYLGDKVDIWALGVVIYVLLVGFMPFKEDDVTKDKYSTPKDVGRDAADFVSRMLVLDPKERYSAKCLLMHPWVEKQSESCRLTKETSESKSIDSDDTSEEELASLDFSVKGSTDMKDKELLDVVESSMGNDGWKTRQFNGSLKASCLSSNGIVMVSVQVNQNTIDVRHANLTKDANVKIMNDLRDLLTKI